MGRNSRSPTSRPPPVKGWGVNRGHTMGDIIDLKARSGRLNNLITATPLEFRRGSWLKGYAMMCTKEESRRFEEHRLEALGTHGHQHIAFVPNHFTLDGGSHFTIMALFRYREDESAMRRIYRLAGLMECVTNAPSGVLRSDLIRRFYQTIMEDREALNVVWRGNVQHFLLPLHTELRNPNLFLHNIAQAESLKELYCAIEAETNLQFDILSEKYVFYMPEGQLVPRPIDPQGM